MTFNQTPYLCQSRFLILYQANDAIVQEMGKSHDASQI